MGSFKGWIWFLGIAFSLKSGASCNDVLSSFSFPEGYGLSPREATRALEISEVKEFVPVLQETIRFFENMHESDLVAFSRFVDSAVAALGILGPWGYPDDRFPREFYRTYLADEDTSESILHERFTLLRDRLQNVNLSREALLTLIYASRALEHRSESYKLSSAELKASVESFIRQKLAKATITPSFKAFVGSDSRLFSMYAKFIRREVIYRQGLLAHYSSASESRFEMDLYRDLSQFEVNALTVEQKLDFALRRMEPELTQLVKTKSVYFQGVTASRKALSNSKKWLELGSSFLFNIIREALDKDNLSFHADIDISIERHRQLLPVFENEEVDNVISLAMENFVRTSMGRLAGTHLNQIRHEIKSRLAALGLKVRATVRELDLEEEQNRQQQLSLQATANRDAHSYKPPTSDGIRSPSIRSVRTMERYAARRALGENPAAGDTTELKKEEMGGLSLQAVSARELQAGVNYWFKTDRNVTVQYVQFTESILADFNRSQADFSLWQRSFLAGLTGGERSSGLKRIRSAAATILWEIKTTSLSERVIVRQDKKTGTWTWLNVVAHDKVDEYRKNNRL